MPERPPGARRALPLLPGWKRSWRSIATCQSSCSGSSSAGISWPQRGQAFIPPSRLVVAVASAGACAGAPAASGSGSTSASVESTTGSGGSSSTTSTYTPWPCRSLSSNSLGAITLSCPCPSSTSSPCPSPTPSPSLSALRISVSSSPPHISFRCGLAGAGAGSSVTAAPKDPASGPAPCPSPSALGISALASSIVVWASPTTSVVGAGFLAAPPKNPSSVPRLRLGRFLCGERRLVPPPLLLTLPLGCAWKKDVSEALPVSRSWRSVAHRAMRVHGSTGSPPELASFLSMPSAVSTIWPGVGTRTVFLAVSP
mmetsp:Transcript_10504/g.31666  ORF Transcript_10504/g.31666 Transcript_10504/m.31666 type:complete len:313 (-) Transcript_10504:1645-2583(-)